MKITKYLILLLAFSLKTNCAADGDLDTTFGNSTPQNGRTVDQIDSVNSFISGIAIEDDGNIIVVGSKRPTPGSINLFVARYDTQGVITSTNFANPFIGQDSSALAVAIQSDGKIVITGSVGTTNSQFATVRYNRDGSLDTSFNGSGVAQIADFGVGASTATSISIQQDGKIVVAGFFSIELVSTSFAIARYNIDGTLDTNFNGTGTAITSFPDPATAFSVAIQADAKIVVVGQTTISGSNSFAIVRYNPNGGLDSSFRGGGQFTEKFTSATQTANSVAIQSDGKIIVGGSLGPLTNEFIVARYLSDGTNDSLFGSFLPGYQTSNFSGAAVFRALAIQSDGKIVAVGTAITGFPSSSYALLRLTSTGLPDASFGTGVDGVGQVITSFNIAPFNLIAAQANAVAIQADGKIVAAGQGVSLAGTFVNMARYIVNNTPLHLPTVQPNSDGTAISGQAQNLSFLTIYDITADPNNPIEICNSVTQPSLISSDTNGNWSCTGLSLTPGVHNLRIVSRYKTSNVNLLSLADITVPEVPVISLEKTGPAAILAGSFINYQINVTNSGSDATNVIVVDQLPEEVTFVSASGAAFIRVGNTVTFTIPSIASGETVILNIRVKSVNLAESRVITNTVTSSTGASTTFDTLLIALTCNLLG